METTWEAQRPPAPTTAPLSWIEKSKRSFRAHALLLIVAILGNLLALGLQVHRLFVDPDRTLSNSTMEFTIPFLTFIICLGGAVLLRRSLHKYRSLMHDTRRCLEMILKEKKQEITALTRWLPASYVGFFLLIVLGKFQSIAAGFESPDNAWTGVWMTAMLLIAVSAALYHRALRFVQPEITELQTTLDSLAAD